MTIGNQTENKPDRERTKNMTCTDIIRNKNKLYTDMTNKELLDAITQVMYMTLRCAK